MFDKPLRGYLEYLSFLGVLLLRPHLLTTDSALREVPNVQKCSADYHPQPIAPVVEKSAAVALVRALGPIQGMR